MLAADEFDHLLALCALFAKIALDFNHKKGIIMPTYKIFYRGDSRSPETIFAEGFQPKFSFVSEVKLSSLRGSTGDCVAVSELFESAAFFPYEGCSPNSWVYVVAVDVDRDDDQYFNVHMKNLTESPVEVAPVLGVADKAKEHIVRSISSSEVLCAFHIERNKETCTFKIAGPTVLNPNAKSLFDVDLKLHAHFQRLTQALVSKIDQVQPLGLRENMFFENLQHMVQSTFFARTRFDSEIKEIVNPVSALDSKTFKAFQNASRSRNSSNVLFANHDALYRQNKLFFQHVVKGGFEESVKKEYKELITTVDKSIGMSLAMTPERARSGMKQAFAEFCQKEPEKLKKAETDLPLTVKLLRS